ncbi:T9SS type A sorting domain-containing protein [Dyadobacter sp. CY323]|uniref:T9SS type A sorting domain-containing protein n=1 Tax=Dyadobacter sp. CY323 TaxID=2907302 RepID=UPI001F41CFC6|nr:T9SS type A sorting domain-containing protein [Dyadobacter sp. CY323]MCE6987622.1 T9SS type A sorting domain-containing protein [Dyadobacter sp. CY323]
MKANKTLLGLFFLAASAMPQFTVAQDVSINIFPIPGSPLNHTNSVLEVAICNEDTENIPADANRLTPLVSFPDNLDILGAVNEDGSPLTNFAIMVMTNDPDNHNIRLINVNPIPNGECFIFHIQIRGNSTEGGGTTTATLGFEGPQTEGNNIGNDNGTAVITVMLNLPVTLKAFNAVAEGKTALLNWSTTEETNSDHFDVQRSSDGKNWKTFETVASHGDSKELNLYSATDKDPLNGENLYRLHMIDRDGSSTYSSIRNVNFEIEPVVVYPNPASNQIKIKTAEWEKIVSIDLTDSNGKSVYKSGEKLESTIDINKLRGGVYTVRIVQKNGSESDHKIVIGK